METITSLSWMNAFKVLTASRGNAWDNRELDVIDGIKFIGFLLL
jgi:hypothetical protein